MRTARWWIVCSCAAVLLGGCSLLYPFDLPEDGGEDGETIDDGDAGETEVPVTCGNGHTDPGEQCDGELDHPCATTCDPTHTTGTQDCVGCSWEACLPPIREDCNGRDDDCDGSTDEGYPCVAGAMLPCTTPCGLDGTGPCTAGCVLPTRATCSAPAEACNGCDDNREGHTDEGCGCVDGWVIEHPLAPGPESLQCVTAVDDASGSAFAVGSGGVILQYDGTTWSRMASGVLDNLRWVDALSADFAVAVGSNGSVVWWNGTSWTYSWSGTTWPLYSVQILAEDDIWKSGFDPAHAKRVMARGASEMSVRYHPDLKKWVAVMNAPEFLSAKVILRTAPQLPGPWTEGKVSYQIPDVQPNAPAYDRDTFCYAGKEHP